MARLYCNGIFQDTPPWRSGRVEPHEDTINLLIPGPLPSLPSLTGKKRSCDQTSVYPMSLMVISSPRPSLTSNNTASNKEVG